MTARPFVVPAFIEVAVSVARRGLLLWTCSVCHGASGYGASVAEAGDAGRDHLRDDCPKVREGLDRLLAQVLAVPEFRTITVNNLDGTEQRITFCGECGSPVDDMGTHVDHHTAAKVARHGA